MSSSCGKIRDSSSNAKTVIVITVIFIHIIIIIIFLKNVLFDKVGYIPATAMHTQMHSCSRLTTFTSPTLYEQ